MSKLKSINERSCRLLAIFAYYLLQSARIRKDRVSLHLHPNLRQSDIIGGVNIGIILQILVLNFFLLEQVGHGPKFHPHKILYFESNLQYPTPHNQDNIGELGCSRLAKLACCTDNSPVQLRIWPVDDSNKNLLEVYLFYMVFDATPTKRDNHIYREFHETGFVFVFTGHFCVLLTTVCQKAQCEYPPPSQLASV